jgi:hypothetical protein
VLGSEFEAALEELRLIRELEPPANSRSRRRERGVYLRRRGDDFVVSKQPGPIGPIGSRRQASLAARALAYATDEEVDRLLDGGPLERLRARLARLSDELRYEEAARLRDRIEALEAVVERLGRLRRLRELRACLVAPAAEPGWRTGFFVAGGLVRSVRPLPPGAGVAVELEAGIACCDVEDGDEPLSAEHAEELLLVGGFVRRPPPELAVLALDAGRIGAHLAGQVRKGQ